MTLSPAMLDECPVWTWNESNDGIVPVRDWNPLPEDLSPMYIKAHFVAADGTEFEGYLIGSDTYYAFGIFVGDAGYGFNLNLVDWFAEELEKICRQLGREHIELFPVAYHSELHFEGEPPLAGYIDPKKRFRR